MNDKNERASAVALFDRCAVFLFCGSDTLCCCCVTCYNSISAVVQSFVNLLLDFPRLSWNFHLRLVARVLIGWLAQHTNAMRTYTLRTASEALAAHHSRLVQHSVLPSAHQLLYCILFTNRAVPNVGLTQMMRYLPLSQMPRQLLWCLCWGDIQVTSCHRKHKRAFRI